MKVYSYAQFGNEGTLINVETDLRRGIPAVDIVGLSDGQIKESRERIRAAIRNSGIDFPPERVLISLSPADIKKDGTQFELGIALSVLNAQNDYNDDPVMALGELDLSGHIRPVRGVLAAVQSAKETGIKNFIVPSENMNEALEVGGINVLPVSSMSEVHDKLLNPEIKVPAWINSREKYYFADGKIEFDEEKVSELNEKEFDKILEGHYETARAIEIAIAGKHNLLLEGSPGCGKTMLSQNLISALTPKLTPKEQIETTRIYSLAGLTKPEEGLKEFAPFRMPHQTAGLEGMLGGGVNLRPGEVTLAHNGTLFLDEASEFRTTTLDGVRIAKNNNAITLSRAGRSTVFPANFQLVAATNPCPCGNYGNHDKICLCSGAAIEQYWNKLDKITRTIEIKQHVEKKENDDRKITIAEMKEHIANAFKIQRENQIYNAKLTPEEIAQKCKLNEQTQNYFEKKFEDKTEIEKTNALKLALTIANMDNRTEIELSDLKEAIELSANVFEKPHEYEYEPQKNVSLSVDEYTDYSKENEIFKYNDIFNEAVQDSYYENMKSVTRIVEYHPEDYGFDKDDKIHLLVEFNNNDGKDYEEDGLFNCLNDSHSVYNGKEIDWNPIDTAIHGSIEDYLEHLKTINEKEQKEKSKYSVDLTNTGYIDDGILTIDLSENENTEFSITAFDKAQNKTTTKKFDFKDLFDGKKNELNILSEPMKVNVNGKERECKNGILAGFKHAVEQIDTLTQEYNALADNYSTIKEKFADLSNQITTLKSGERKSNIHDYTAW